MVRAVDPMHGHARDAKPIDIGTRAERVAISLYDPHGYAGLAQLIGATALRSTRWMQGECQCHNGSGVVVNRSTAADACTAGPTSDDQRQRPEAALLAHHPDNGLPRGVQLMRWRRRSAPGEPVGLQ